MFFVALVLADMWFVSSEVIRVCSIRLPELPLRKRCTRCLVAWLGSGER